MMAKRARVSGHELCEVLRAVGMSLVRDVGRTFARWVGVVTGVEKPGIGAEPLALIYILCCFAGNLRVPEVGLEPTLPLRGTGF